MNKKWLWIVLATAALLFSAWFFWYRHYQDRQKFERIEAAVSELSNRINTKFDINSSVSNRYCEYATRKFEDGPLSCVIEVILNDSKSSYFEFVSQQDDLIASTIWQDEDVGAVALVSPSNTVCSINQNEGNNFILSCSDHALKPHYQLEE